MPQYSFGLIPVGALQFDGASPWSLQQGDGQGWQYGSYSFSYDPSSVTTILVDDEDDVLQDDPSNPEWGAGNSHQPHSQVLGADLVVDATQYSAGIRVENEYELNVTGPDGTVYRLVAISVPSDPGNPYSSHFVLGFTFDHGLWPPAGTQLTSVAGSAQDYQVLDQPSNPPCFVAGTLISTPNGPRPVESLLIGDLVTTLDRGDQPLRWIGRTHMSPEALAEDPAQHPVQIAAGALGTGVPQTDLRVSPQHRMLLRSRVAQRMFDSDEVLAPARALLGLPGVTVAPAPEGVDYWHFALPGHHVVLADGAPAESLYVGPMILEGIPEQMRAEMLRSFPQLSDYAVTPPTPARPMLRRREAEALVERLVRNKRLALEPEAAIQRRA